MDICRDFSDDLRCCPLQRYDGRNSTGPEDDRVRSALANIQKDNRSILCGHAKGVKGARFQKRLETGERLYTLNNACPSFRQLLVSKNIKSTADHFDLPNPYLLTCSLDEDVKASSTCER